MEITFITSIYWAEVFSGILWVSIFSDLWGSTEYLQTYSTGPWNFRAPFRDMIHGQSDGGFLAKTWYMINGRTKSYKFSTFSLFPLHTKRFATKQSDTNIDFQINGGVKLTDKIRQGLNLNMRSKVAYYLEESESWIFWSLISTDWAFREKHLVARNSIAWTLMVQKIRLMERSSSLFKRAACQTLSKALAISSATMVDSP